METRAHPGGPAPAPAVAPTAPHCLPPLPPLLGAASQGLTLLTAPGGTPTHAYSVPGCAVHPQAGVNTLGQGPADRQRQGLVWRTKHLSPRNPAHWTHLWMATATTGLGVQAAGPLGKGWPERRGWRWEGAAILTWPGKCGPLVRGGTRCTRKALSLHHFSCVSVYVCPLSARP